MTVWRVRNVSLSLLSSTKGRGPSCWQKCCLQPAIQLVWDFCALRRLMLFLTSVSSTTSFGYQVSKYLLNTISLPREAVDAPSLGILKVRMDRALSTWWSCRCPCSMQGSWTRWPLWVPSNSNRSVKVSSNSNHSNIRCCPEESL